MIKCIEDKYLIVRKEVFTILLRILKAYPESNDEIQQCLIDSLKNDPSSEIRGLIVSNIIVNEDTLPLIIERSRDIDYNVRKASFKIISENLSFEDIPSSYRIYLLKSGLLDMKNVLIQSPEKTRSYFVSTIKKFVLTLNNSVTNFLTLLDIENNEKLIEDVLSLFYKYHRISLDQFNIEYESPQYFLFWRTYCDFLHTNMSISSRDQIYEEIIPDSTKLCLLLQYHFEMGNQFIVKQLLKIILIADHDEVGIRRIQTSVSNMILNCKNIENCKLLTKVLYKLNSKYSEFVRTVLELISEIKDPLGTKTQDEEWLICLSLCEELLQTMDQTHFVPIISELDETLLSPAIQHQDPNTRKLAITCLGLYCSLRKSFAKKYIDLILKIIQFDHESIKLIAIQVLFDLVMIFGINTFEQDNSIKEILIEYLTHEEVSIRTICIEGFCKLYLSGELTQADILSKMCFELFNPLTNIEKYKKIQHIIKCFLPIYVQKGPSNLLNLKEAVIMLLKFIVTSRSTPKYLLKDIIKYFVGLLDHRILMDHKNGSEYCINRIGEYLLGDIIKNPYGDQGTYYTELLLMLPWNPNETFESYKRIKSLCENALKVIKNKTSVNHLEKTCAQIDAIKPFLKEEVKEEPNSFSKSFDDTLDLSIPANQEGIHIRDEIKNVKRNRLKKKRSEIDNESSDLVKDVSDTSMKIKKLSDSDSFTSTKKQLIEDQISKLLELAGDSKNSDQISNVLQQMKDQLSNLITSKNEEKPKIRSKKESVSSNQVNTKTIQFLSESISKPKKDKSFTLTKNSNSKRKRATVDDDDVVVYQPPPKKDKKLKDEDICSDTNKSIYVSLSGFNDNNSNYNLHFRDKLKSMLESMGVKVAIDKMSRKITHTISPPDSITIRTLISLIWGQWVLNADWVLESYKQKKLLKEDEFGSKLKSNPFLNKKVFITDNFIKENKSRYNKEQFKLLIEKAGKGKIVDNAEDNTDYVLVGPKENVQFYKSSQCLRWNQFFSIISPKKEIK